jgi:tetratricopeptide (TPR) repeat protein
MDDTERGHPPSSPAARDGELPAGTNVGRYVVLRHVGRGGMGDVYAAYDPELDRQIALKLVRAEAFAAAEVAGGRMRLLREAQALARLSHPHVLAVHDAGTYGEQVFVATELVEGTNLRAWLRVRRSWREVLAVFLPAAAGLGAAHAAGLVHRDFKPENVLLGDDGRIRVADFGLARPVSAGPPADDAQVEALLRATTVPLRRGPLSSPLTRAGEILGTPEYMAPEQALEGRADARSDQFSFCVALYEALYGERPFPGRGLVEILRAAVSGAVRSPPAGARVPAFLRRAVLRGLSADPALRHPSMEALRAALAADPARRWRRYGLALVAMAAAAGAAIAVWRAGEAGARICRGGAERLAGVWDPSRREEARGAFLATGRPFAAEAWNAAERFLDAYAQGWVAMHREACEATRLRGEQSEELLDLRMHCLAARREELRALSALLARADGALVGRAAQAAAELTPLGECADAQGLRARTPLPRDPKERAELEAVRARVAEARVQHLSGRFAEGLRVATAAAAAAARLGHRPVLAEALLDRGWLEGRAGRTTEAEETLHQAVLAAEAGGAGAVAARAWTAMVWVVGLRQARHGDGLRAADHAAAFLDRIGEQGELRAELFNLAGLLHEARGRYGEALAHQQRSLELRQRAFGEDHPKVAGARSSLGWVLFRRGDYAAALAEHRRALDVRQRSLGKEHPFVAYSLLHIGTVLAAVGRPSEAVAPCRRAVEIRRAATGPESFSVALAEQSLGSVLADAGHLDEAERILGRVLARLEAQGRDHPAAASTLEALARAHHRRGRLAEARAVYERALAIREKRLGPAHPDLSEVLDGLGETLQAEGRPGEATALHERAITISLGALGEDHPLLARSLGLLGQARLALGQRRPALQALERALAIAEARPGDPERLADIRFSLARALPPGEGERARRLATSAREVYRRRGVLGRGKLARVERWLGRRSGEGVAPNPLRR